MEKEHLIKQMKFLQYFSSAATTDEERQQMPEVAQFHLGNYKLIIRKINNSI